MLESLLTTNTQHKQDVKTRHHLILRCPEKVTELNYVISLSEYVYRIQKQVKHLKW